MNQEVVDINQKLVNKNSLQFRGGGPRRMLTCKLYLRNEGTINWHCEIKVTETIALGEGKIESKVIHQISTQDPITTMNTLEKYGVMSSEVVQAEDSMVLHGHNCSHFGVNGSFMYSEFEGALQ